MELNRPPSDRELRLLEFLVKNSSITIAPNWDRNLGVIPMEDGGMGSLRLLPDGHDNEDRKFGRRVSEYQFKDVDGVLVIASLNDDQYNHIFELDIWKTNFDELIRFPDL